MFSTFLDYSHTPLNSMTKSWFWLRFAISSGLSPILFFLLTSTLHLSSKYLTQVIKYGFSDSILQHRWRGVSPFLLVSFARSESIFRIKSTIYLSYCSLVIEIIAWCKIEFLYWFCSWSPMKIWLSVLPSSRWLWIFCNVFKQGLTIACNSWSYEPYKL